MVTKSNAGKEQNAANILKMAKWSNHVIQWLVSEIVSVKDNLKQRVLVLEKVVMLAKNCYSLNNFNAVKEVLAAIESSAVYRLKKTRDGLSSKHSKILEELITLTANEMNYKNLRAKVHSVDPPLIPFPGIYQGDLVFLEGSAKDRLENDMINFQKLQKISSYIIELQTYQQHVYHLQHVPDLQTMIKSALPLDEASAYLLSLACEPRLQA